MTIVQYILVKPELFVFTHTVETEGLGNIANW